MIDNGGDFAGKILGTCMLEVPIGRGGMSAVYRARQLQPVQRLVAVKILLPSVPIGSELHQQFLARFQREAQIISRLRHVNIIPNYEYGEQDGKAYLVMPYLAGGSLSRLLARRGVLTLAEALNYIEQAAAALDYAHRHGVIHRDLKPSNFLLHGDGRLVLSDFGIAHIVRESGRSIGSTLTLPGVVLGTPDYMSPEMAQGDPIDHRSDIYELGIVLFQMLDGDVPFKGTTAAVILQHMREMPPLLNAINPTIPQAVDDVIQRATSKSPEDRFASAGEMARALRLASDTPPAYSRGGSVNYAPTALAMTASPSAYAASTPTAAAYPAASSIPGISKSRSRKPGGILPQVLTILAFMLVIAAMPLGLWIAGSQSGQPRPPVHDQRHIQLSQQAQDTVLQYYKYWNQGDYQDAYYLLSPDYRKHNSYDSLLPSYIATKNTSTQIDSVTPLPDGSFNVAIIDTATEEDTPGTLTTHIYNGYYTVTPKSGSWQLYPHFTY